MKKAGGYLLALISAGGSAAAAESFALPNGALELIIASGVIGYIICAMSVVAVAVIIDAYMATRQERLLPAGVLQNIESCLDEGDYNGALVACQQDNSMLARVVASGVGKINYGFERMVEAAEEERVAQEARLEQKLGLINIIAIAAPSLGLLGTVAGMVSAFGTMAAQGGSADASTLAGGIYVALMTTLEGLVVSIPAAAAFSVLRGRVVRILAMMTIINGEILDRFRQPGG
ncbi:MAG: MotA/TolQ/ExbB proton channel family protein [Planctomycetota bacterium]|jgi:biopolymer transport protein ExbB|nr:MotA/TolQ/ExbB proton channel family protein [Planctomycetota bacterium]